MKFDSNSSFAALACYNVRLVTWLNAIRLKHSADGFPMSTPKMKFIEMTGTTLESMLDERELKELAGAGVDDNSLVRINEHGDIEVRRVSKWDVIGGLLGDYEARLKKQTGLEWA